MRSAGPDAPTLCEGWTTRDLAAHLVIREYRLDAAPGIVVPAFAGRTAKVQDDVTKSTDWEQLLDKIASGPPIYSPLKLLDPVANVAEMFIHHEDVRRAKTGLGAAGSRRRHGLGLDEVAEVHGAHEHGQSARPRRAAHARRQDAGHRRQGARGDGHRRARRTAAVCRRTRGAGRVRG
ncbi:TIGR03085 family metal-binding protein [Mycobacterium hubeiense]|uniref:TIGR03085 family metal-binding protein n=1 Tax=Mycobacterium hubeiense TaxID=1867256 RepID=UPI003D67DFD6